MPYAHPDLLVTTQWLAERLNAPDIRIADATYRMPGVTPTAAESYRAGHIPGAVFFNIEEIADTNNPLPHMVASPEKFASRMRSLGLGDGNRIVLYDAGGIIGAARAWWNLRYFGHRDLGILNGGLRLWLSEGRSLDDTPAPPRTRHFTPRINSLIIRTKEQVRANLTSRQEQVVDARSPERFAGTAPEPWPGRRPGHIPGSYNVDHTSLVDPATGCLLDAKTIRSRFMAAGVDLDKPIITSCGSGITACVLAFALHIIGCKDVAVYDGSWAEWGLPGDTPVETGPRV